jgi:hypothetical protein
MKKLILFICISALFISCTKESAIGLRTDELQSPVVTGYYMRDEQGAVMGVFGGSTPNVKLEHNNKEYFLTIFPNPIRKDRGAYLYLKSPPNTLKKFWITKANNPRGVNNLNSTVLVAGGMPIFQMETYGNWLYIDANTVFQGLPEGYYRAYLKINDVLLYDNLLIINPN